MTAAAPQAPFTEESARPLGPVRRYLVTHPVAADWLVIAFFAVGVLGPARGADAPAWLWPAALVAGAALWWRRRAPLVALGVTTLLAAAMLAATGDLHGLDVAAALALYAVAAARPTRTAWLAFAALILAALGAAGLWSVTAGARGGGAGVDPLVDLRLGQVIGLAVASLLAVAIGVGVRGRREHIAALVERANLLAFEREAVERLAAAAERARIAREMHDVLAHSLTVMIALADGAAATLERRPQSAATALTELSATGRTALADVRRVLGTLREDDDRTAADRGTADPGRAAVPDPVDPSVGLAAVERLVDRFRAAGLPITCTATGPDLPPDSALRLATYRIVQESLTNVLRHAPGSSRVDVRLEVRPGEGPGEVDTAVLVVDNTANGATPAAPVDSSPGSGRGIMGMRERAASCGGTAEAGPTASGWRVRAVLRAEGRGGDARE